MLERIADGILHEEVVTYRNVRGVTCELPA